MDLQNVGLDNHDVVMCFAQLGGHTGVVDPLRLDLRDIADQGLARGWRTAELHVRTSTGCGDSGRHREQYGIALPVEEYLVAQKSQDGQRGNRTLRRVSLHIGKLIPKDQNKSGDEVPVEVSATTTIASTGITRNP
eukprot:2297573-Pleurochrysis_carterae.AAC.1